MRQQGVFLSDSIFFLNAYNIYMIEEIIINGPNKKFEDIKKVDENNVEYWTARELFPLFGYSTWQAFDEVIGRAARSALNSGQTVENHFSLLTKLVDVGSNTKREIKDYFMD